MFIGHFAVGLGAKAFKPKLSLGTYFLAGQFLDLLWPTLLLLHVEKVAIAPGITAMTPLDFISYPYSHSLVMALVWSAAAFVIVYIFTKDVSVAIVTGLCVVSHWVLDFFTHRPDLPLTLNESTKVGLGLWNYIIITVLIETIMFVSAVIFYIRCTKPADKIGSYGFWSLILFLFFIHVGNIMGPPPPDVMAIAWAGHLQWLFVLWAYWVDRHRTLKS
jgi:hypothetical protein